MTVRVTTVAAVDRRLVAWMLARQRGLAVGVTLLTAADEQRIGQPKRLGLVATAVLFEESYEHRPRPTVLPGHSTFRPPYRLAIHRSSTDQPLFAASQAPKPLLYTCEIRHEVRTTTPSLSFSVRMLVIDC